MGANLSLYTVPHTATIRDAMERIEANKHRAVVVLDDDRCVVGVVSDGDVRRAFLHDVMPISPVTRIMQLNPQVTQEADPKRRQELIRSMRVTVLPVVTADNHLVDVELAYEPSFDA